VDRAAHVLAPGRVADDAQRIRPTPLGDGAKLGLSTILKRSSLDGFRVACP